MSENTFKSRYTVGDHVLLKPATAKIVAIMFGPAVQGGPPVPFYTIMLDGNPQPMQGVPESEVTGRDYQAEQAEKNTRAAAGQQNRLSLATSEGLRQEVSPGAANPQAFGFASEEQLQQTMADDRADDLDSEISPPTGSNSGEIASHALEGRADNLSL